MNMQMMILQDSWQTALQGEMKKPYFDKLLEFVEKERQIHKVYPPADLVFNALDATPLDQVKVVIVGQDPYHGEGQAHGLSFSVPEGVAAPPSLKNIFKELKRDLNIEPPKHGNLQSWANQGVLLLNSTLTVRQGAPMSHHGRGWEQFTDAIIHLAAQKKEPLVFVLWGKSAQDKCRFLLKDTPRGTKEFFQNNHLVLLAPHPSPLSCHQGFLGCNHFSRINTFLTSNNISPIHWNLK